MQSYDLVVIGGGSAGLKTARTVARSGRKVAVIEERELGGECFWAGCVPTKALLRAAQVWHQVRHTEQYGIKVKVEEADFPAAMAYKDRLMREIGGEGPSDGGLSKIGADFFPVRGSFESAHEVRVGDEVIRGEQILVATGTVPATPPIPGLSEAGFITNRDAIHLTSLPKRLVVLGGGPIGLEFAQVFRRFGSEVTLVEWGPHILSREDAEIAAHAETYLKEEGIRVLTSTMCAEVKSSDGTKWVTLHHQGQTEEIVCDEILVATGRSAAVGGMNIEAAGLSLNGKRLPVDEHLRTPVAHIWAAGDITMGQLFTHVASYEGKLVAHNLYSENPVMVDHSVVPRCTYIDPEVASVGLTEREAVMTGYDVVKHVFPFAHLDRAILHGEPRGLVKLIAEAGSGRILGGHLIGHEASSLLAEIAICMRHKLPVSAIADTMHAYPSFPEAIEAAALSPGIPV